MANSYIILALNHHTSAKRILSSGFKLFSGTGSAQILMLLTVPFLTRLCTTAEFGAFGMFMAITTFSAVLISGRYELAIPLPKNDETAWTLFLLTLGLGVGFSVVGFPFALFFHLPLLGQWTALLSLSILFMMGITSSEYWLNRKGLFTWVSVSRFVGATGIVALQVGLVMKGVKAVGLVAGFTAGLGLTFVLNLWKAWRVRPSGHEPFLATARAFERFPRFMMGAQVCNSAANHLPTVLIGTHFGPSIAGFYTLANRAMTMVDLLPTAVGQAFYPEIARHYGEGLDCYPLLKSTLEKLAILGVVLFPVIYFVSPWAFSFVFGAEWRYSGELVRWLLPMFFFRFVTCPATLLPMIAGRQDLYLLRQVVLFLLVLAALYAGKFTQSFHATVALYASVYTAFYLFDTYLAVLLVKKRRDVDTSKDALSFP